jgi:uncharacterized protein YndB with AHSA1/START domain
MAKIEASVVIDRPVEEVWNFITDLSKTPKWDTPVSEVKLTSTGPLGVGSTGEMKAMRTTISIRVTEYEPNRRLSFEHTSGPMKGGIDTFSVEAIDGKTKLTEGGSYKLSGFYRLLGLFISSSRMRRGVEVTLNNAKRMLETEAPS